MLPISTPAINEDELVNIMEMQTCGRKRPGLIDPKTRSALFFF
jgi:hypothetical protein